jgi:hypothetical protein
MTEQTLVPVEAIAATILTIRGQRVILDSDLAKLYGVETRRLNEQVRRNAERFPADFLFQLTREEYDEVLRSQNATLKTGRGQHRKYLPYVFTEHGTLMAANVLNSERAIEVSLFVVRAFIQQRAMLATNAELALKLERLEKRLLVTFSMHEDRLDDHENQLEQILEAIKEMRQQHVHRPIGFRPGKNDGKLPR